MNLRADIDYFHCYSRFSVHQKFMGTKLLLKTTMSLIHQKSIKHIRLHSEAKPDQDTVHKMQCITKGHCSTIILGDHYAVGVAGDLGCGRNVTF